MFNIVLKRIFIDNLRCMRIFIGVWFGYIKLSGVCFVLYQNWLVWIRKSIKPLLRSYTVYAMIIVFFTCSYTWWKAPRSSSIEKLIIIRIFKPKLSRKGSETQDSDNSVWDVNNVTNIEIYSIWYDMLWMKSQNFEGKGKEPRDN